MNKVLKMSFLSAFGLVCLWFIADLLGIGARSSIQPRAQGKLTACKSNLKNIGTALEMYASDNGGLYPRSIADKLTPNYLKTIPTCPEARVDTYTSSYKVSKRLKDYTFFCSGLNHGSAAIITDFPQYNSNQGLVTGGP